MLLPLPRLPRALAPFAVLSVALFIAKAAWGAPSETPLAPVKLAPAAAGEPVLEIAGGTRTCRYTLAELEKFDTFETAVRSMWANDDGRYQGVRLAAVLKDCGVADTATLEARAVNGYQVSVPREDWQRWDLLLATRKNGQPMAVRDKGPLRLIYVFGDTADAATRERTATRWIWMLNRLDVPATR